MIYAYLSGCVFKKKKSKKFYICARAVTVVERVGSEIKGMVFWALEYFIV